MNSDHFSCPACTFSDNHKVFLSRQPVPTLQNTIVRSHSEALNFPAASLAMTQCKKCSFVWNKDFSDNLINYDESYDNNVLGSQFYRKHLAERVDALLSSVPADQPIHYVDIGCGEADFLRLLVERSEGRTVSAMGFDPSFSGTVPLPDNAVVHREFFTQESYSKIPAQANVICSRHTIEHIANPRAFAKTLADFIKRPDQTLFIETPTVDWIFQNVAFYDFFFEHCSLFNPASLNQMFGEFGLGGEIQTVYGDQYMWAKFNRLNPGKQVSQTNPDPDMLLAKYLEQSKSVIEKWVDRFANLRDNQRIGIWGAASKGVTFALIMKQAGYDISFAIDLNRQKQDCYIPVSGIKIQSPEAAGLTSGDTVIVMNPNYLQEITTDIERLGVSPEVTCL